MSKSIRLPSVVVLCLLVTGLACQRTQQPSDQTSQVPPVPASEIAEPQTEGRGEPSTDAAEPTEAWRRILTDGKVFHREDLALLLQILDFSVQTGVSKTDRTTFQHVGLDNTDSRISYDALVAEYGPPDATEEATEESPKSYRYGYVVLFASPDGKQILSQSISLPYAVWAVLRHYVLGEWPEWGRFETVPEDLALPDGPLAADAEREAGSNGAE